MNDELRWVQRFQNLERAYALFERRVEEFQRFADQEAYQMALVQGFEIVIELSWKTIKDYLQHAGYSEVRNGKHAVRQAFQDSLISDAEVWMGALEKRDLTSHLYDTILLQEILAFIHKQFYPAVQELVEKLRNHRDEEL